MQDSTPGWTRYIEDLEAQAARLPRRRRSVPTPAGLLAAVRAMGRQLAALLGRPEIGG
ncbi:MAG: hypothetical protein QM699_02370 [Amaricoccus sp.]|uniref:hypothetical protein n=1 Tax=Amaricoccus sp. TaxID=1872485 RepID=UPI0039E672A0